METERRKYNSSGIQFGSRKSPYSHQRTGRLSTRPMLRVSSQPNLMSHRSNQQGVSMRNPNESGPFQWSPLATKTAVGIGSSFFGFNGDGVIRSGNLKHRPKSAPAFKMKRSGSYSEESLDSSSLFSMSLVSTNGLQRRHHHRSHSYLQTEITLCVRAFQNGSYDNHARVTATNLNQLLDECTDKLGLASAARKLYLEDGTLISDPRQLEKDCIIYVSCGEPFKHPLELTKEQRRMKTLTSWTPNGIILPYDSSQEKEAPALSQRMKQLVSSTRHRMLVFKNGCSSDGAEIVSKGYNEFLDECSIRLNLETAAKALYSIDGKPVRHLEQVSALEDCLQPCASYIYGPLWVTKGEQFSPKGAYDYASSLLFKTKKRLAIAKKQLLQLTSFEDETSDYMIEPYAVIEAEEQISILESEVEKLAQNLDALKERYEEEESMGRMYKFSHISAIESTSHLMSFNGHRIKVHRNGSGDDHGIQVVLNISDITKGCKTANQMHSQFMNTLNDNLPLVEDLLGVGKKGTFKRAFLSDGTEVKDVTMLKSGEDLWLSLGEEFIPFKNMVLGIRCHVVRILASTLDLQIAVKGEVFDDQNISKASQWMTVSQVSTDCKKQDRPQDELQNSIVQANRLPLDGVFLQNKKDQSLCLYPNISPVMTREDENILSGNKNIMQWMLSEDGTICNKLFPELLLTVDDQCHAASRSSAVEGFAVYLNKRGSHSVNQQWRICENGMIASSQHAELYLTFVDEHDMTLIAPEINSSLKSENQEEQILNQDVPRVEVSSPIHDIRLATSPASEDDRHSDSDSPLTEDKISHQIHLMNSAPSKEDVNATDEAPELNKPVLCGGHMSCLAVLPLAESNNKLKQCQRWAFKTPSGAPYTPEQPFGDTWLHQKLQWPVDSRGAFVQNATLGYLLIKAPKMKMKPKETAVHRVVGQPTRLSVKKNGSTKSQKAIIITGPDLTHVRL